MGAAEQHLPFVGWGQAEDPLEKLEQMLERRRGKVAEWLPAFEEAVKDLVSSDIGNDHLLRLTTSLVIQAELEGRSLYASPIEEPFFYRNYFRPWVVEGLEERAKMVNELKGVDG